MGQMLSSHHTAAVVKVMIYLSHQTSKRYKYILWVELKPFLVCTWPLFQTHNVTNLIASSHVTPENTKTMHLHNNEILIEWHVLIIQASDSYKLIELLQKEDMSV